MKGIPRHLLVKIGIKKFTTAPKRLTVELTSFIRTVNALFALATWRLYQVVAHNPLRTCERNLTKMFEAYAAVNVIKCMKQINLSVLVLTCAMGYEAPSDISIMISAGDLISVADLDSYHLPNGSNFLKSGVNC